MENNSDNFPLLRHVRLPPLEAKKPTGNPLADTPSVPTARIAREPQLVSSASNALANASRPDNRVPPISGPSILGLSQPDTNRQSPNQPNASQSDPDLARTNEPTVDLLRDKAFSGLDSFFEPEQPKSGKGRIVLMIVLLAALGAASWWTYTNYIGPAESRKSSNQTATSPDKTPASDAGSQPSAPPANVAEGPSENANPPDSARQGTSPETKSANAEQPSSPPPPTAHATPNKIAPKATPKATAKSTPKIAIRQKPTAKREPLATAHKTAPPPATSDTGDAEFRKAEAYLYGRGGPENCDEATKYLKAASAKSNPKARSTFGTMYATGHCVARDLPTSYLWFALALKVDPNNQILEKDLSAVWNQMTPPERQMATRMKQ